MRYNLNVKNVADNLVQLITLYRNLAGSLFFAFMEPADMGNTFACVIYNELLQTFARGSFAYVTGMNY